MCSNMMEENGTSGRIGRNGDGWKPKSERRLEARKGKKGKKKTVEEKASKAEEEMEPPRSVQFDDRSRFINAAHQLIWFPVPGNRFQVEIVFFCGYFSKFKNFFYFCLLYFSPNPFLPLEIEYLYLRYRISNKKRKRNIDCDIINREEKKYFLI